MLLTDSLFLGGNLPLAAYDPGRVVQYRLGDYGADPAVIPFGDGNTCIASPVNRHAVINAGFDGLSRYTIDMTDPMVAGTEIQPGATTRFLYWFRDPAAGGAGLNLSDALALTFAP